MRIITAFNSEPFKIYNGACFPVIRNDGQLFIQKDADDAEPNWPVRVCNDLITTKQAVLNFEGRDFTLTVSRASVDEEQNQYDRNKVLVPERGAVTPENVLDFFGKRPGTQERIMIWFPESRMTLAKLEYANGAEVDFLDFDPEVAASFPECRNFIGSDLVVLEPNQTIHVCVKPHDLPPYQTPASHSWKWNGSTITVDGKVPPVSWNSWN